MMDQQQSLLSMMEAALAELEANLSGSRSLIIPAGTQQELRRAIGRARAKLLACVEPALVVALAGGSGAGKSSLINALAGASIARVSAQRPTTTRATVYLHEAVDRSVLPPGIAADASFVTHQRAELRHMVLVDTPDLDSFRTEHRAYTTNLLQRADLVLYTFSSQNYEDERVWSVLQAERRFSRAAALLNKVDLLDPADRPLVLDDLKASLARVGLAEAPVYCTSALPAQRPADADADHDADQPAPAGAVVNELPELERWLVQEWREQQISALKASQADQVLNHLRERLSAALPADAEENLAAIVARIRSSETLWGEALARQLGPRWATIRQAVWPAVMMALHNRLAGPFRGYLAVVDFFRFALPLAISRMIGRNADTLYDALRTQLDPTPTVLSELVSDLRSEIGSWLYDAGLPVQPWLQNDGPEARAGASAGQIGPELAEALAGGLEQDWLGGEQPRPSDRVLSVLGTAGPAMLVVWGIYALIADMAAPPYEGWGILGHMLAVCIVWWILLHGLLMLLQGRGLLARSLEPAAARIAGRFLTRRLGGELERYAAALRGEISRLAEPVEKLAGLLSRLSAR